MYKCEDCGKTFDEPIVCSEGHGLDAPPFESLKKCPYCFGVGLREKEKVNPYIEKTIVAQQILNALYKLQRFMYHWHIGEPCKDIECVQGELVELLVDICDCGGQDYIDRLFKITTKEEADEVIRDIGEEIDG